MHFYIKLAFIFLFTLANHSFAGPQHATELHKLFTQWTHAFNQKKLNETCRLFSKKVTADYRGYPTKNYDAICNGFKKIFSEKNRSYQYSFEIHQSYQSGNLATVRLTWYLNVYDQHKLIEATQDEGIDILEKNTAGEWRIVNYLGYAIPVVDTQRSMA